jgi:hypothetical protein
MMGRRCRAGTITAASGIDLTMARARSHADGTAPPARSPVAGAIGGLCMFCPPDAKVAVLRRLLAKASKRSGDME